MPDNTDDGPQPTRRTLTRPPLFTPRVTRSDAPESERAATATRRGSRLFTPPRVPRHTTPPAGERTTPPAVSLPPEEPSPVAGAAMPAAPDIAREAPAAAGVASEASPPAPEAEREPAVADAVAASAPSSPEHDRAEPDAAAVSAPPLPAPEPAPTATAPESASAAPSAPPPAPAQPRETSAAEPRQPLVVGDIETADIALTASAGSGLIDRAEASIPEAEAASAVVPEEPARPEPRGTIGGVEIERPVWTFLPENEGTLPAVELPAMPAEPAELQDAAEPAELQDAAEPAELQDAAEPAELQDAAEPPPLDGIERSPDGGAWESAPAGPGSAETAEPLEIDHAWLVQPEDATRGDPGAPGTQDETAEGDALEATVAERDAVTQEIDAVPAGSLAAEPAAVPEVVPSVEDPEAPAAPVGDEVEPEVVAEPAPRASDSAAAPPEEEVDEAWAEATRPDAAERDAYADGDALGAPMGEAPRERYFAPQSVPDGHDDDATAREVDEMTAALGWPETPADSLADAAAALPALDAELRESAALLAAPPGAAPAVDVAAALERIARRVRDGQVVLPRDAAAGSEESALAVTLAALLKGPPRG